MNTFIDDDVEAVAEAFAQWIGLVRPDEPERVLATRLLLAVVPAMRDRWLTELADEVAGWEPVAGWLRSKRSGGDQ